MSELFTLHQLRVFLAVYEEGNIRGAAERLHRTPSAISMTLKQFEDRVGSNLFESDRKNQLTEVGLLVVQEVRTFLEHADRTERSIISYGQGLSGQLDVACVPSISVAFLPRTLSRYWEGHPNVRINVRDMDSRSAQEAVETGIAEIGVAAPYSRLETLAFTPLFEDRLALVCAEDDPLCNVAQPIGWEMLGERTFFSNNTHKHIRTPAFLEIEAGKKADFPNVVSLLSLVRNKAGVTVLPQLSSLQGASGVRFLPLADESATRVVGVLARHGHTLSPAARGFIDILTDIVAEHAGDYAVSVSFPTGIISGWPGSLPSATGRS